MASFVAFETARHLMAGLSLCWEPDVFPEQVTVLRSGWLAVPVEGFSHLAEVAASHGFRIQPVAGTPRGSHVPLADLAIGDYWTYHDPLHWDAGGYRRADRLRDGTRYQLREPRIEYIVGARDRAEAASLLTKLMAHLPDGVEVTPLVLRGAQPFTHFWLIGGHRPPLGVLQDAPRAWWGPAGDLTPTCVFVQWPLSLYVSPLTLQRIPWNAGEGLVLLSREAPERLVVTVAEGRRRSWPIDIFSAPQPVETYHMKVSVDEPNAEFPIELRLRPRTDADSVDARLTALNRELERYQQIVGELTQERTRLQEQANLATLSFPEPLLLYYGDGRQVPRELRRLLIEWSNQPGDLNALRCARFSAIDFPKGLDRQYEAVHVVTTAQVLGAARERGAAAPSGAPDRTLPVRLEGYAPGEGAYPCFEQLEEWVPFDLRLFVPRRSALRLHPRLPATPVAAAKLAHALFGHPVTREEWRRSLILLVQGDRDRLVACHIPTNVFEPVAQVFDWQCTVNINLRTSVVAAAAESAAHAFVDGLAHSLEGALSEEAREAMSGRRSRMEKHMRAQADIVKNYEDDLAALVKGVADVDEEWQKADSRLELLAREVSQIEGSLSSLERSLPQLSAAAAGVHKAASELKGHHDALARTRAEIERLRDEIAAHPGGWQS